MLEETIKIKCYQIIDYSSKSYYIEPVTNKGNTQMGIWIPKKYVFAIDHDKQIITMSRSVLGLYGFLNKLAINDEVVANG